MQYKLIKNKKDLSIINTEWEGSHLQGEIDVSYKTLVSIFGKQNVKTDGYKIDAEWLIHTPYGQGTIYNYKSGKNYLGKDGLAIKDIRDWHIGGINKEIYNCILDIINQSQKK